MTDHPTCTETAEALFGRRLTCDGPAGHPPPHVDPVDGCEWRPVTVAALTGLDPDQDPAPEFSRNPGTYAARNAVAALLSSLYGWLRLSTRTAAAVAAIEVVERRRDHGRSMPAGLIAAAAALADLHQSATGAEVETNVAERSLTLRVQILDRRELARVGALLSELLLAPSHPARPAGTADPSLPWSDPDADIRGDIAATLTLLLEQQRGDASGGAR